MSFQPEMVYEHNTLEQTSAGVELERQLRKEREKSRRERAEAQEELKRALKARDHQSAEELRRYNDEMNRKIEMIVQEREQLKVSMEKMHRDGYAKLDEKLRKQDKDNKRELQELRQSQLDVETLRKEKKTIQERLNQALAKVSARNHPPVCAAVDPGTHTLRSRTEPHR
ncbi:hypothetical protein CDD83_10714 [Cordyceps sp. RAO-2017]|nr:hypothetical protein CDD83_10714 [Cordyceps sp. RAO-2017]